MLACLLLHFLQELDFKFKNFYVVFDLVNVVPLKMEKCINLIFQKNFLAQVLPRIKFKTKN